MRMTLSVSKHPFSGQRTHFGESATDVLFIAFSSTANLGLSAPQFDLPGRASCSPRRRASTSSTGRTHSCAMCSRVDDNEPRTAERLEKDPFPGRPAGNSEPVPLSALHWGFATTAVLPLYMPPGMVPSSFLDLQTCNQVSLGPLFVTASICCPFFSNPGA